MRRGLALCLLACCALASGAEHKKKPVKPAGGDAKAEGFLNLYVELCVRHLSELEDFRAKLLRDGVPKLRDEDAKAFLSGMAGDAWPVPYQGQTGNYVLALPAGKNLCMLHARRANAAAVEKGFLDIVAEAPPPMVAKRGPGGAGLTRDGIRTRTVSSTWAPPGARRQMQFTLTTTASGEAGRQALGSVAIVNDGPPLKEGSGSAAPAPRPRARP